MSAAGNKQVPPPPDAAPEGVGIGSPGGTRVAPASDHPGPAKPAAGPGNVGEPASRVNQESEQERTALLREAIESARKLKRGHRALYDADPRAFRDTVRKAQGRVFRLKPGPKQDEQVAQAARERTRGIPWPELYVKYIPRYASAPEYYRPLLEGGFQRKVNHYLQRHPLLRRRGQKSEDGTATQGSPPDCT